MKKQPTLLRLFQRADNRPENKTFSFLRPDFLACLPTFVNQLKLRGLSKEEAGGKIFLQMAHRVFGRASQYSEYTLINTANDFAALLSKFDGSDVEHLINYLLDNLTEAETELFVTVVLKLEHMENPDNYARGESLAGQLIKIISARQGLAILMLICSTP
jgi:hypothetical protein